MTFSRAAADLNRRDNYLRDEINSELKGLQAIAEQRLKPTEDVEDVTTILDDVETTIKAIRAMLVERDNAINAPDAR